MAERWPNEIKNRATMINPLSLIPAPITAWVNQYFFWIRIALYAFAVCAIFASGCWITHKIDTANYERAENDRISKEIADNKARQDGANYIDDIGTKELADANKKIADLRYCLIRGTCRLSIPTMCKPNSPSSCVDNAAARTDLDAGTATSLIAITERGDKAIIQLKACQNILKGLH